MAFPWIFESNFEGGSSAEWDSEQDTGSLLDFPHYGVLAGSSGGGPQAPYRGAYCMRIVLGDTNDHTVTEGDLDVADTVTRWSSFYFYISNDFTVGGAADIFNIFELQSAAAVQAVVGLDVTAAGVIRIGTGKVTPTTVDSTNPLEKGRWYHIELQANIQTGGTGAVTVYVDGVQRATVGTLTHIAVTTGSLGSQDTLSTTVGTLLFDCFRFDDAQVYPFKDRYPQAVNFTKTSHIFIGPGWIQGAAILSTSGTLQLYDSDSANSNNAEAVVDLDTAVGLGAFDGGAYFERGCYAVLSGTTRAEVRLSSGSTFRGQHGPTAHWSPGAIRSYAKRRYLKG